MNNRKSLSFHVARPKFTKPCYADISCSQLSSPKGARVYDINTKESPLMRCIRKNLLFPRRYHNKIKGKKTFSRTSAGVSQPKHRCTDGKHGEWTNYGIMKETFQPKVLRQDLIKKTLDIIHETTLGLNEIKSRKDNLKKGGLSKDKMKSQDICNILDEMEPWI